MSPTIERIANPNNEVKNGVTHHVYIENGRIVHVEKIINQKVVQTYDWSYMSVEELREVALCSGHESYTLITQ